MTESDLIRRHQAAQRAAHRVMDVIDQTMRDEDRMKSAGPRTGTHPMATRLPPDVPAPRGPMATRNPPHFDPTPTIRITQRVITLTAWMTVFLAGIAVGRSI